MNFIKKIQHLRSNVLVGKTITMYPYGMEYLDDILRLRNQSKTKYFLAQEYDISREQQIEWIKKYEKKEYEFGFVLKNKRNEIVGISFCYNYDGNSMELGRATFDTAKLMGMPYAFETISMLTDTGFNFLGLERLKSTIKSDNHGLLKFYSKLNWSVTGECTIRGNQYKLVELKAGQSKHELFAHLFDRIQSKEPA